MLVTQGDVSGHHLDERALEGGMAHGYSGDNDNVGSPDLNECADGPKRAWSLAAYSALWACDHQAIATQVAVCMEPVTRTGSRYNAAAT